MPHNASCSDKWKNDIAQHKRISDKTVQKKKKKEDDNVIFTQSTLLAVTSYFTQFISMLCVLSRALSSSLVFTLLYPVPPFPSSAPIPSPPSLPSSPLLSAPLPSSPPLLCSPLLPPAAHRALHPLH